MWHLAKVEIAFGAPRTIDIAAIDAAAWVNVTDDIAKFDTDRGRNEALDDIQGGRGNITLDNGADAARGATEKRYSPGWNPAAENLLDTARASAGSSLAGQTPDLIEYGAGTTNVVFVVAATADTAFQHPFVYRVTVTAGATGTPKFLTKAAGDGNSGPFSHDAIMRVEPSTAHRFSFQHKLVSGTATAVVPVVHWLDSDGVELSTSTGTSVTPTGTVAQKNLSATSPAGARYAAVEITYSGVPAAASVQEFTALQLREGTDSTLLDPLNAPNITPNQPIKLSIQDSGSTYRNVFVGFTGEWSENIDDETVTVTVSDLFELLAELDIVTGIEESLKQIDPLAHVPLDDPAETLKDYRIVNRFGLTRADLPRTVRGTDAAAQLSEWTFGEPGPQEGLGAVDLDPESETVGYALSIDIPEQLQLWTPGSTDPHFSFGGWFQITRREHGDSTVGGARYHNLFNWTHQPTNTLAVGLLMTDTGALELDVYDVNQNPLETALTGGGYYDGEPHFVYCELNKIGAGNYDLTITVDDDGTNGEVVTENFASTFTHQDHHFQLQLGGRIGNNGTGFSMMRGRLSSWFWHDNELTTAQRQGLYRAGAPPAITPGEAEDVRIGRLLDYAGWPAGQRALDPGLSLITGPTPSKTNILYAIKQTAESVGGTVYVNRSGKLAYANRRARYNPTTDLVCSTATASVPEDDIQPINSPTHIYNRVRVTRAAGDSIEVNDTASQEQNGIRTLELDMSLLSDDDAWQGAYWFLHLYSKPQTRVGTVTFNASAATTSNTLWDYLVTADLMKDSAIDLNVVQLVGVLFFVEHIHLEYEQESATFSGTLQLSPAEGHTGICVFDDPTDLGRFDYCRFGW